MGEAISHEIDFENTVRGCVDMGSGCHFAGTRRALLAMTGSLSRQLVETTCWGNAKAQPLRTT